MRRSPPVPFMRLVLPPVLALVGACDGTSPRGSAQDDAHARPPAGAASHPGAAPPPAPAAAPPGRGSLYTSVAVEDCQVVERDQEAGGYRARCPGAGGFRLELVEGDARASLDVLPPRGARVPLALSTMAGGAFSRLGPRVEWRSQAGAPPDALVVRYEAFEFPEQPGRTRSYLVVAKLSATDACVVATIPPQDAQNAEARAAADNAVRLACVQPGAAQRPLP